MSAVASREEPQAGGRSLPSNIEAEATLIGAMLINNDLIPAIAALVAADDFFEPVHARLAAAIFERSLEGKAVNPVLLWPQFQGDSELEQLGGRGYLARLTGDMAGLLVPIDLAEQIRDMAARRRTAQSLSAALDALGDNSASLADIHQLAAEAFHGLPQLGKASFELLDIADLEAMPPPSWLIRDLIGEDGLSIIYGEPGAGKSFIALDMALRVAAGHDWHGTPAKQTGVLYIAGEGARGIGKRVTGWRMAHGLKSLSAPFLLLPVPVQVTDDTELVTLLRTIDAAKARAGFEIGLIVVDTVSRSLAGVDENSQEAMTRFVRACDAIKAHAGGALLGIHHSGKDRERGMRGSSVLLGAVDTAIRADKSEHLVTLKTEKQKDAEEGSPAFFELVQFEWQAGAPDNPGPTLSTLVPRRTDAVSTEASAGINGSMISAAFAIMVDAWTDGRPLSHRPQTQKDGRFAPRIFNSRLGGEADAWAVLIASWLENDCLAFDVFDKGTKQRGLRVITPL